MQMHALASLYCTVVVQVPTGVLIYKLYVLQLQVRSIHSLILISTKPSFA
jgi:hypothetical protein